MATSVPGTMICEHLPRLAQKAHLYTLVRSLSHDDLDHGSATYLALTGQPHPRKSSNPPALPTDYPTYGAILQRASPSNLLPYTAVHVNGPAFVPEYAAPGQNAGFLGRACEPLLIGDPTDEPIALRGLDPLPEVSASRLADRRAPLQALDGFEGAARSEPCARWSNRIVWRMTCSRRSRCGRRLIYHGNRCDYASAYGLHRSGRSCLLARWLVEAGVPWITVVWNHTNRGQDKQPEQTDWYGWDTHNDIFDALKIHLLPRFDQSFSALLEDLQQRGLLDSTLVVCMGEFGRRRWWRWRRTSLAPHRDASTGPACTRLSWPVPASGAAASWGRRIAAARIPAIRRWVRGTLRQRCFTPSVSRRTVITPIQQTGPLPSRKGSRSPPCTHNEPFMNPLAEAILQLGAGRVLRAFADLFIH